MNVGLAYGAKNGCWKEESTVDAMMPRKVMEKEKRE